MARWFRVIDTSRFCGLPIVVSCIMFAIITGACQTFSLYFLPVGAAIPLMITAGAVCVGGIVACLKGFRWLTVLYLIAVILVQIPVFVVIGFVSYTISIYNWDICRVCRIVYVNQYCDQSSYENYLCGMNNGLLWAGIIIAFIACVVVGSAMQSFRILRLHQAGVGTVVQEGRRGHYHQEVRVVQPVQTMQTVYTVPANTVVTAAPQQYVMQTNPPGYPTMAPPPVYATVATVGQGGTVQAVNYNPPINPDF